MKKVLVLLAVIVIYSNSFSQSIGVSGLLASYNSYEKLGYGLSFELGYPLSNSFDLKLSSTFLFDKKTVSGKELKFFQLPISLGIRYFVSKNVFSPFIGIGIGTNYTKEETVYYSNNLNQLLKGSEVFENYSIELSVGTYYEINSRVNLVACLRNYTIINYNQSLAAINVGFIYKF